MNQLQKDAAAVADLLQEKYVPRCPTNDNDGVYRTDDAEHCAVTAIAAVTRAGMTWQVAVGNTGRHWDLREAVRERVAPDSTPMKWHTPVWSDAAGKEAVVAVFRDIAGTNVGEPTPEKEITIVPDSTPVPEPITIPEPTPVPLRTPEPVKVPERV